MKIGTPKIKRDSILVVYLEFLGIQHSPEDTLQSATVRAAGCLLVSDEVLHGCKFAISRIPSIGSCVNRIDNAFVRPALADPSRQNIVLRLYLFQNALAIDHVERLAESGRLGALTDNVTTREADRYKEADRRIRDIQVHGASSCRIVAEGVRDPGHLADGVELHLRRQLAELIARK